MVSNNNKIIKAFYGYEDEGKELVLIKNYLEILQLITKVVSLIIISSMEYLIHIGINFVSLIMKNVQ